jgi:ABC-type sugar transport system substrate-binding protein
MTMRTIIIASLLALAAGTAHAADNSADTSAKKTGDGFGNLLKGMGQEVKKTGVGKTTRRRPSPPAAGRQEVALPR